MENFLAEIYRRLRSNQVGIIIDGEDLSSDVLHELPKLGKKLKEVGEIRITQVMYENNVPEEEFELLRESGYTDVVVPGNIELSFLMDAYDIVLEKKVDFIVLGTTRDELIPLFAELRKNVTVFAFVDDIERVSKAFTESLDGIIRANYIDEFTFSGHSFSEFEQIMNNDATSDKYTEMSKGENVGDEANIGTVSEDLIEDKELIEEMKKEQKNEDSE